MLTVCDEFLAAESGCNLSIIDHVNHRPDAGPVTDHEDALDVPVLLQIELKNSHHDQKLEAAFKV